MWTHPITLLGITSILASAAWLVKMVLENNKISYAVAETVKEIQNEMKEMRKEFDELRGQHHAMTQAGNMLAQHNFIQQKKTRPTYVKSKPSSKRVR